MCGIAGAVNYNLPQQEVKRLLLHRGPDEQTHWDGGNVQFIHTRLAIQELSPAGRQPMHLGHLHLMFNGEIYNHFELRKKFGLKCSSHSDTETLLQLFRLKGASILHELDGMFAIAIYDEEARTLWLARDRAGEKPLYYYKKNDVLIFASELRVIHSTIRPAINSQRISNFLATGYLPGEETPYDDVYELPPGTFMKTDVTDMRSQVACWFDIGERYHENRNLGLAEALEETDYLLNQSVRRRLESSDLEVGAFLSGGIDSGLVTAIATRYNAKLKTFTVSFDGLYDEAPLARTVADRLGTDHHQLEIAFDRLDQDLEQIFANYGEPMMDDSIIPSYYVAKEARKHLTVVLNGDAGDELFGGYRRYVPFANYDFFKARGRKFSRLARSLMPVPADKMSGYNYLYRLVSLMASRPSHAYFAATNDLLHTYQVFSVPPELEAYTGKIDTVRANGLSALKKIMLLDSTFLLPSILLVKMDIATMVNSLEGRSPFLSKELLELVPGLPDRLKVRRGRTKLLLRKLAKKYLPVEIVDQPKRGFEVPLRSWVDAKLKTIIHDHLTPGSAYVRSLLSPRFVDDLIANRAVEVNPEQRARVLFALLSVEIWKKSLT